MRGRDYWALKDLGGQMNPSTNLAYQLGLLRGLETGASMCEDFNHTAPMGLLIRAAGLATVDPATGKPPPEVVDE